MILEAKQESWGFAQILQFLLCKKVETLRNVLIFVSKASERKACGHRLVGEKPNVCGCVCVCVLQGLFFFF